MKEYEHWKDLHLKGRFEEAREYWTNHREVLVAQKKALETQTAIHKKRVRETSDLRDIKV